MIHKTITLQVTLGIRLPDQPESERTKFPDSVFIGDALRRWYANQPTINPHRTDPGLVAMDYHEVDV